MPTGLTAAGYSVPQWPASNRLDRVLFVSQARAEAMKPPQSTALVSITDPGAPAAQLQPGWSRILRVAFDDIDPVSFPDDYSDRHAMSDDLGLLIACFVCELGSSHRRIVVHCKYGVSRSAAVAKAIAAPAKLRFPPWYEEHNEYVYRAVLSGFERLLGARTF
jgi:predicted protein tyrosine phosphatase